MSRYLHNLDLNPRIFFRKSFVPLFLTLALIFWGGIGASILAQEPTKSQILAIIGQETITTVEFLERYEGVIWRGKHIQSWSERNKQEVLLSMIAEKILYQKGLEHGFENDPAVQTILRNLQEALIRDRLYFEEIKNQVNVSQAEIQAGYEKMVSPRVVRMYRVASEEAARALTRDLAAGGDLDTLAFYSDENHTRQNTMTWGESPAHVDSIIFNLEVDETSSYFEWDGLFYFAKLKQIIAPAIFDPIDFNNKQTLVKQILQQRKEFKRLREFIPTIMPGQAATIKKEAVAALMQSITDVIMTQKDSIPDMDDPFSFTFKDLHDLSEKMKSFEDQTVVVFQDTTWTYQQIAELFEIHGLKLIPSDSIIKQIVHILQDYIDDYWLTLEGYRRGLDKHPDVIKDLEKWRRSYLSKLTNSFYSQLLEDDKYPLLIKIREILVDSEETADRIMAKLGNGANFGDLAREFTIRKGRQETDGEFDYFNPETEFTEIGVIAKNLETGQRYGPLKIAEGYSIFELLDKSLPPEMAYQALQPSGVFNSHPKPVETEIARLANEHRFSINMDALRKIQVTDINMFTVRYLGFGGTIPAVPQLEPLFNWYDLIKDETP